MNPLSPSSVSPAELEQLRRWDREIVWHAFTQMSEYEPLIFTAGEGRTLIDIDGNRYLDATSSIWCNLHGHRHPTINAAIRAQLDQVAHVTSLGASNPTTIRLAKRLTEIAPPGLNHVFFSDSGATAVEVALKMAFQYWRQRENPRPEKTRYIALGEAYHGDTLGSVAVGGVERFHQMFAPLLFQPLRIETPNMYRLPAGVTRETACQYFLNQIEAVLQKHADQCVAVVIEPLVQGAAGMLMHPAGFLHGVRELTRRYDVLLIADEVAVGFGRTGTMFACEQEGVTPDLMCIAKGISGGYLPLAATLATTEIWNAFLGSYTDSKTFFHGHTYGGNPLGCAAGLGSLQVFEEEQTLANLPAKIAQLQAHLARIAELPHVGDVRQCGMIVGIELVANKQTKEPYDWAERRGIAACLAARKHGVLVRPLGNVIVVMPPLNTTAAELDQIMQAVEQGINETTKS